jgi:hypothetical protein
LEAKLVMAIEAAPVQARASPENVGASPVKSGPSVAAPSGAASPASTPASVSVNRRPSSVPLAEQPSPDKRNAEARAPTSDGLIRGSNTRGNYHVLWLRQMRRSAFLVCAG